MLFKRMDEMTPAIAYITALFVFAAIDAAWLTTMGSTLYRPVLGDILLSSVRLVPAIAFYLVYPIGIVTFAVTPALRAESLITALALGLLFGAIAYATYDLTNYATLRNWNFTITVIDVVYGAIATGVASCAAYLLVRSLSGWISL
jgi:uncharacterized membrane protein